MTTGVAAEAGVTFLERLLRLSERSPDRVHPASAAPPYEELATADLMRRFEERMAAAERAGAVELRRGKRERRHLIERVRVADAAVLARHLGRAPAEMRAQELKKLLEPVASEGAGWVPELLAGMTERWARGEPAYRIDVSSADQAREFVSLLAAISNGKAEGLDGRTFALRTTGDSKAFDRHAGRVLQVLSGRLGDRQLPDETVWASIGLERYAHPVHMRGCVLAEDEKGVLVHGRARPFGSFHPDLAERLCLCGAPAAVVTIENYASFNRYVREVDDEALVVYTGGFGSAGVIKLLRAVLSLMDHDVPVFHWGDVDPGGLRIFRFLEQSLPRKPLPHLMDRQLVEAHGRPADREPALGPLARTDSAVADLAAWLAEGEDVMHLEQEALDPSSPLATRPDHSARAL